MPKFRKKPVEIEAIRFDGKNDGEVHSWARELSTYPIVAMADSNGVHLLIRTLEGEMRADSGDWIICGVKRELYPCKPDIFAATYEPVI